MSRRGWIVLGAAVGALAAGWLWRAAVERRSLQAEVVATEREVAEAKTQLAAVRDQHASADARRAELERAWSQHAGNVKVPEAKAASPTEGPKTAARNWADFLLSAKDDEADPKVQLRDLANRRSWQRDRYSAFFVLAGLSPEAEATFVENCANRDANNQDLNAAARKQGIEFNDPGISRMRGEIYQEYDKSQRALLGEAGFAKLQEYERTASLRTLVGAVAGAAAVEGAAFSPAQAETVLQVLASASASYQRGRQGSATDIDWAMAEPQLATLLTPAQMTFFRTVEAPGGVFHSRWNGELIRAIDGERARKKK